MTDAQLAQSDTKILHIPSAIDAVVPIYNVAGAVKLRFTPQILAGIFLGRIKTWDDPSIVRINPGIGLSAQEIIVVHRSDGCAATSIFTDYLSKVSPVWKESVGSGTSVKWPLGLGAKGDEGVASSVRQLSGAMNCPVLVVCCATMEITLPSRPSWRCRRSAATEG